MTITLQTLLYLVAVILLFLAAFGVNTRRVSLGWLGLAIGLFAAWILPVF